MPDLRDAIFDTLSRFDARAVLDILLVAAVIYAVLLLLRGTAAMSLLRGVAMIIIAVIIFGYFFQLTVVGWLVRNVLLIIGLAIPIVFQPEIRRALERLGRARITTADATIAQALAPAITRAVGRLSERRHGALIVVERETGLGDHIESGVKLDAETTAELLVSIFQPGAALHDGAVIIREGRIAAAGCVLPLGALSSDLPMLGTRHRAALGVTADRDALSVVVSEETGLISLAHDGKLRRGLDLPTLERMLSALLRPRTGRPVRPQSSRRVKKQSPAQD